MPRSSWTPVVLAAIFTAGAVLTACAQSASETEASTEALSAEAAAAQRTLEDLAAFGEKRVGTPGGARAAAYVKDRMTAAGLQNVHFEEFDFPQHIADVGASKLSVTSGGQPIAPIAFDVFEGSGNGRVENAPVIFVGSAKPEDLAGKDLRGKIAFVARDSRFHRSSQYRNVAAAGAVAMLYMSAVPDNQIQIGSIREKWEAMGPIPTITIGEEDGDNVRCLLGSGGSAHCDRHGEVRATIEVKAHTAHGTGRNVIGMIPGKHFGQRDAAGKSLDHQIVYGAHYDTWYVGSVDNGCGVATLLGLAVTRGRPTTPPEHTIVFVAFDGEEVGLYGGYDYLRVHQNDGILSVTNFEMPAAETDLLSGGITTLVSGVASSEIAVLDAVLDDADVTGLFTAFAVHYSLDKVARMFGGIIPTDIQGIYRSGIPTVTTASDSPWYHTRKDTPDKVDTGAVARAVRAFSRATDELLKKPVEAFKVLDPKLWDADVTVTSAGTNADVTVTLKTTDGRRLPSTNVTGTFFCDDFYAARELVAKTDANGVATLAFPSEPLATCTGRRWVHVTAGPDYPLVEKARAVPSP